MTKPLEPAERDFGDQLYFAPEMQINYLILMIKI